MPEEETEKEVLRLDPKPGNGGYAAPPKRGFDKFPLNNSLQKSNISRKSKPDLFQAERK